MLRAVLDVNVLISALLSRTGTPAKLLREWHDGAFELVLSPALIAELSRALAYPRITRYVSADEAEAFTASLAAGATMLQDASSMTYRSSDPDDDYLLALAEEQGAVVVSGDAHLLAFADRLPVYTPAAFLAMLSR